MRTRVCQPKRKETSRGKFQNQIESLLGKSRGAVIRELGVSPPEVWGARFYGQRTKRKSESGAMQQAGRLTDGERFLVDTHWWEAISTFWK